VSWYYTREAGDTGQVLTDEGTPPGVNISDIVRDGPMPMGASLELIAYLADVLTIAEEDKALHGDISPGDVYVDDKGAVSLSGYGPMRAQGRAPEGRPMFPASDVYGLGVVLHAVVATQSLGAIPRERDAHDDAIVERLLAIDWSALGQMPGRDSLIHFLCSMLAHTPSERPAPLDVANVLAGVGQKLGDPGVAAWAKKRWSGGSRLIDEELPTLSEVLAAPADLGRVFNKTGQYSRRQSASVKGECTAFWSKDKIASMLDEGEDHLAGSQMFQRQALNARLDGGAQPQRLPPSVVRSPFVPPPPKPPADYPKEVQWVPDSTISGKPADPVMVAAMAEMKAQLEAQKPAPAAPTRRPTPPPAVTQTVSPPPHRPAPAKQTPWLLVVLAVVGMLLVLGVFALVGVVYYTSQNPSQTPAATVVTPAVEAEAPKEEEAEKAKPRASKKRRRAATQKVSPRRAKASKAQKVASRPPPPPPPPLPTGEFDVTFRSMAAEAVLTCGDGQTGRFVGVTRRKFSDITTCRVVIDGKQGTVQLRYPSTVTCVVKDGVVVCTGA
jgi:hypothetical protein